MDMKEFAALKVGDKVRNPMFDFSSTGEVIAVEPEGVRIVWGRRHADERSFFFSVVSTAWKHWSRVEPEGAAS